MSSEQCSIKFKINKITKAKWTVEEDNKLLKLLESKYLQGSKVSWFEIALMFQDKSSKQCYNRYQHINPLFQKGYWTKEEEDKNGLDQ